MKRCHLPPVLLLLLLALSLLSLSFRRHLLLPRGGGALSPHGADALLRRLAATDVDGDQVVADAAALLANGSVGAGTGSWAGVGAGTAGSWPRGGRGVSPFGGAEWPGAGRGAPLAGTGWCGGPWPGAASCPPPWSSSWSGASPATISLPSSSSGAPPATGITSSTTIDNNSWQPFNATATALFGPNWREKTTVEDDCVEIRSTAPSRGGRGGRRARSQKPPAAPLAPPPDSVDRTDSSEADWSDENIRIVCEIFMHDTNVLFHALRLDHDKFPHPPQGKYYLADAGYPNRPGYLAPYKGHRYHVPEWRKGPAPRGQQELFNHLHSCIRNVIERTFGVWKMKWRVVLKMPSYPMKKQKMIVAATMCLHNFIRENDSDDKDFSRCDRNPDYVPTIPKRYRKYTPTNAGDTSTMADDDRDMDKFRDDLSRAIYLSR